jgi:hypothetical protein
LIRHFLTVTQMQEDIVSQLYRFRLAKYRWWLCLTQMWRGLSCSVAQVSHNQNPID